jgi:hypothetical protein
MPPPIESFTLLENKLQNLEDSYEAGKASGSRLPNTPVNH